MLILRKQYIYGWFDDPYSLIYLLFSLPYNVEVVVPNWSISRGNCWGAHTIFHHHRIFNVPEIRVWVRTEDLHCESL